MNNSGKIITVAEADNYYENVSMDGDNLVLQNVVYLCAYSLAGILALLGNIIVVYVVFRLPDMRTFVHILLANMAASDIVCALSFFTGLILCSDSIITVGGNGYCVANKAIQLLTFQVTSFTMTVIALDRWLSVFFPFRHNEIKQQCHRLTKVIVGIWIASLAIILVSSPSLAYQSYFSSNGLIQCEESTVFQVFGSTVETAKTQLLIANLAHFWIPLSIITVAYGAIILKVWKRKLGNDLTQSQIDMMTLQKWKTIKMLIATVTVFVLCWLPFFIFNIIAFKVDSSKKRPCNQSIIYLVVIWMAFSSCCYNPLVYWIYNETYRLGIVVFLNLFKCNRGVSTYGIQNSRICYPNADFVNSVTISKRELNK